MVTCIQGVVNVFWSSGILRIHKIRHFYPDYQRQLNISQLPRQIFTLLFLLKTMVNIYFFKFLPQLFYCINLLINLLGISVVNPQLKLTSLIQKFTWGVMNSSKNVFPAGLNVDPRTGSLVLNSRTGFVQFYDIHTKNLLYNVSFHISFVLLNSKMIINAIINVIIINIIAIDFNFYNCRLI